MNDFVLEEAMTRCPLVESFLIASTCIVATSLTSTIANLRSGNMGSLPLRIRSTREIEEPKFLSNGAPNTKTGLIVVSTISGASFSTKFHAACSAKVFDFV